MRLVEHAEGKTKLLVPSVSLTQDPPPRSPVFFNPAASLNRDVSVAITSATGGSTFCDSMAGVGARGVRVANEVEGVDEVTLVDFNPDALKAARRAAALNGVLRKCKFSISETSAFLFSRYGKEQRFDYVDVDPFGTPVRQLPAALAATSDGGVLSVTATDTAVLCGVYPRVAVRRYGSAPLNNHFHHETGIRILVAAIARQGAILEVGVEPVAAHSSRHYVRVFLRVRAGATKADSALRNLGYVAWCPNCSHTWPSTEAVGSCEKCGKRTKVAGPLWLGGLTDERMLPSVAKAAGRMGLNSASRVVSSLAGVDGFPPWSYSIERICSSLKVATVPESMVYQNLRDSGHRAMRTPFEKTGIKTDAHFADVLAAVRASVGVVARVANPGADSRR